MIQYILFETFEKDYSSISDSVWEAVLFRHPDENSKVELLDRRSKDGSFYVSGQHLQMIFKWQEDRLRHFVNDLYTTLRNEYLKEDFEERESITANVKDKLNKVENLRNSEFLHLINPTIEDASDPLIKEYIEALSWSIFLDFVNMNGEEITLDVFLYQYNQFSDLQWIDIISHTESLIEYQDDYFNKKERFEINDIPYILSYSEKASIIEWQTNKFLRFAKLELHKIWSSFRSYKSNPLKEAFISDAQSKYSELVNCTEDYGIMLMKPSDTTPKESEGWNSIQAKALDCFLIKVKDGICELDSNYQETIDADADSSTSKRKDKPYSEILFSGQVIAWYILTKHDGEGRYNKSEKFREYSRYCLTQKSSTIKDSYYKLIRKLKGRKSVDVMRSSGLISKVMSLCDKLNDVNVKKHLQEA